MEYKKYYISDENGNSNCVIRTFCKVFNKNYSEVKNELIEISRKLKASSYNDTEVFEKYLSQKGYFPEETDKSIKVSNLELSKETRIILCWDKKDYYHMLPIINNTIYDKNSDSLDLYVLKIYSNKED